MKTNYLTLADNAGVTGTCNIDGGGNVFQAGSISKVNGQFQLDRRNDSELRQQHQFDDFQLLACETCRHGDACF